MRIAHSPIERLGFLIRTVSTLVGACLLTGLLVSPASATHFRYGTISWVQVSDTTVEATVQQAWRRAGFISCVDPTHPDVLTNPFPPFGTAVIPCTGDGGFVGIGDVAAPFSAALQWGDGSAGTPLYMLVTSVDLVNNWFFGEALDPASLPSEGAPTDTTLPHTYAATNMDYTAFFESCCRLSPPILINNADRGFSVETTINIVAGGGTNNSPVSGLPPIVLCPVNSLCSFSVPAADPDGDTLSFRLSLSDEAKGIPSAGEPDAFVQPGFAGPDDPGVGNPASIDVNTGLYTWDTTGAGSSGDLYSTQVTIEDGSPPGTPGTSKTAVDFLIELAPADLNPPTITSTPDNVCGSGNAQTVAAGSSLIFTITGSDPDGDALTLNVAGLPAGASMTDPLPLSEPPSMDVSSQFSWTPLIGDVGTSITNFFVSNFVGGFALCPVTINVIENFIPIAIDDPTPPDPPTPGGPDITANSGETINIDVLANDLNLDDGVLALTPTPSAGATAVVVGTAPNLSVDYTSALGFGGEDTFTYTITDTDGDESNVAFVTIDVDGAVSETPPDSSNVKIFGGTTSFVALKAVGDFTEDGGTSRIICGAVPDSRVFLKKGVIKHRSNKFDIGLAKNALAAFIDTPTLLEGELVLSKSVHVHTGNPDESNPANHLFGLCFVDTFFWQGPISLDVDASQVDGIPAVQCKPNLGIDRQPIIFARATFPPEFAKLMRPISTQCDPRGVAKWSQSWILVNGEHVTPKSPSQNYVHHMSALLKNLISAMQDDGAIVSTDPLSGAVFALVLDAEMLFKEQRESATFADIELAMSFLDDATILALEPPSPGPPYVSTLRFDNPKGELVSHLTALRYAVCSEIALGLAPSGSDLSICVMRADVVDALPTL